MIKFTYQTHFYYLFVHDLIAYLVSVVRDLAATMAYISRYASCCQLLPGVAYRIVMVTLYCPPYQNCYAFMLRVSVLAKVVCHFSVL